MLPNTDDQAAHAVAERCRQLILDQRILHERSPLGPHLTDSFDVATATATDAMDPLEPLETADYHLYRAMNGGRNRVQSPN